MDDDTKKFQDALNQATGERTAAKQAASNASLDQMTADFERTAADPTSIYAGKPDLIERTRTQLAALRMRAGLAPTVAPKTPQQIAAQQHEQSFSMPAEINSNLAELIDGQLAHLKANPDLRDSQEKALKEKLGPADYAALLSDAQLYLGSAKMTPEVKASEHALRTAAAQAKYNAARRAGTPR
jgi:hypothetical protein